MCCLDRLLKTIMGATSSSSSDDSEAPTPSTAHGINGGGHSAVISSRRDSSDNKTSSSSSSSSSASSDEVPQLLMDPLRRTLHIHTYTSGEIARVRVRPTDTIRDVKQSFILDQHAVRVTHARITFEFEEPTNIF
jgi:hypothetical protein